MHDQVNFQAEFNRFVLNFLSTRPVAISKLQSPVRPSIHSDLYLSLEYLHYVKCLQSCSGFEFGCLCPFSMTMTITSQKFPVFNL